MGEFELINRIFKTIPHLRTDVIMGIGDDAACLQVPGDKQLLVSSDTLVADVHFLSTWDAYDIAYKAVMVNVSDIAAMAAEPCWLTLALTLPAIDIPWLERFAMGLRAALNCFNVALIGGDTTRGPLSMTLTIHGLVSKDAAVYRHGARPGDKIYVSGPLGAAAFAVVLQRHPELKHAKLFTEDERVILLQKLQAPFPRVDLGPYLQRYATAAIDISDGLLGDLQHICEASHVGAKLELAAIPVHSLIEGESGALDFALSGGDDYELCFTVSAEIEQAFVNELADAHLTCYAIGVIEAEVGLRARTLTGETVVLNAVGYQHFD